MNKQKGIIIGVLALVVTMMVGYAIFSETITINGTATAKGDFNIDYACELVTEDLTYDGTTIGKTVGGTGTCTIEGNIIKATSTLNKPTDMVLYKVTLTNNGSIPAVLKNVDSPNNFNATMDGAGDAFYIDKTNLLTSYYGFFGNGVNGVVGDTASEQANITLQPTESVDMIIINIWDDSSDLVQPKLPENGVTWNYNVTLDFEQVTAN